VAYLSQCFISVSSLLGINAVELRDALTTNSNVTRGERIEKSSNKVIRTPKGTANMIVALVR